MSSPALKLLGISRGGPVPAGGLPPRRCLTRRSAGVTPRVDFDGPDARVTEPSIQPAGADLFNAPGVTKRGHVRRSACTQAP